MTRRARLVRYEGLPAGRAPSNEALIAALYDVLGDVWDLLEGGVLDYLPARSRDPRLGELVHQAHAVQHRVEYLVKRFYGGPWGDVLDRGYDELYHRSGEPRPRLRTPPNLRTKGRVRKREARDMRRQWRQAR